MVMWIWLDWGLDPKLNIRVIVDSNYEAIKSDTVNQTDVGPDKIPLVKVY